MWIGDKVDVLEAKTVKKGKVKMKKVASGKIIEHIGQIGLADETSEFRVLINTGATIEITEDFLKIIKE